MASQDREQFETEQVKRTEEYVRLLVTYMPAAVALFDLHFRAPMGASIGALPSLCGSSVPRWS